MKKGFTLIELMITIAIIGILAKVAIVGYTSYVQRSNRAIAIHVLGQSAAKLEQYYSQNGRYLTSSDAWPTGVIESSVKGNGGVTYTLAYAPSTPNSSFRQTFSIIATPVGSVQSTDSSGKICINNLGAITENAADNCGISTLVRPSFCTGGGGYPPCSGVCQDGGPFSACSGNCDRVKICGNPVTVGCSGNCQDSVIEGPCSGNCDRVILYVPQSMTTPCSGNCHNITIIRTN